MRLLLLLVMVGLVPTVANAGWIYVDPNMTSVQVGAWNPTANAWQTFNLGAGDWYVDSVASTATPLNQVQPYPPLAGSMVIQAVNQGLTFDPYAQDPTNPANVPVIGALFGQFAGTMVIVSMLGYAIGWGSLGLLAFVRRSTRW